MKILSTVYIVKIGELKIPNDLFAKSPPQIITAYIERSKMWDLARTGNCKIFFHKKIFCTLIKYSFQLNEILSTLYNC